MQKLTNSLNFRRNDKNIQEKLHIIIENVNTKVNQCTLKKPSHDVLVSEYVNIVESADKNTNIDSLDVTELSVYFNYKFPEPSNFS